MRYMSDVYNNILQKSADARRYRWITSINLLLFIDSRMSDSDSSSSSAFSNDFEEYFADFSDGHGADNNDSETDRSSSSSAFSDFEQFFDSDEDGHNVVGAAGKHGILGYQFEPEYNGEELAEQEAAAGNDMNDNDPEPEGPEEVDRTILDVDEWCKCHNCTGMATHIESACCQDFDIILAKMERLEVNPENGEGPLECVCTHEDFVPVTLNPAVIETTMARLHHAFIERREDNQRPTNKCLRHGAYRQFIFWVHGFLGKKVRRVVPSCVVKRIRGTFPADDGQYVGFLEAPMDDLNLDDEP